MKPVVFIAQEAWQKNCWKAIRNNVGDYFKHNNISQKCNREMVIKTITMLALYIFPFIAVLYLGQANFFTFILALLMGIGKAGIGMSVMHDGLHGSYSGKKWVNNLAGASMYLIGSNVLNWKIQHNIHHHAYTNIHGADEDIQTRWILRFSKHTPLRLINRFQHIYALLLYSLMTFSMLFGDYTQLFIYHKAGILKQHKINLNQELIKMSIIKFSYLFVMIGLPILITPLAWWQIMIGFVIMHLVAGFIMSLIFQLAHIVEGTHQPDTDYTDSVYTNWAIHQINTTSNFARNNRLLNWYVGGLNFQIEHHLFPGICHVHYRHISPIIERTINEYGGTYNMKATFISAIKSHLLTLKKLGNTPAENKFT